MSENEVIENRSRLWDQKTDAGEGFDPLPGHECVTCAPHLGLPRPGPCGLALFGDIDALTAELGPCVYEARRDDDVAVFRRGDGAYTLVGNAHGPWAVTVAGEVK